MTRAFSDHAHLPKALTWACTCGDEWPCEPLRAELRTVYRDAPSSLTMLLLAAFSEAVHDLRDAPAGPLYDRFVSWAFEDTKDAR